MREIGSSEIISDSDSKEVYHFIGVRAEQVSTENSVGALLNYRLSPPPKRVHYMRVHQEVRLVLNRTHRKLVFLAALVASFVIAAGQLTAGGVVSRTVTVNEQWP